MNRLVNAVGKDYLAGRDAEMLGNNALNGFAFGINRQTFRRKLLQFREDARTRCERVLIEVEAQRMAARERRMILRHREHASARLRHRRGALVEFVRNYSFLNHDSPLTISLTIAHPHADAFGMGLQTFRFRERDGVWSNLAKRFAGVLLHSDDLHKIEHAEAAADPPVASR